MDRKILPVRRLAGAVRVPADKSIAHRAAIVAGLADGHSRLRGYPRGADTLSTLRCLTQLGIGVDWDGEDVIILGRGVRGLEAPREALDCGNSGTTMRLLAGLLSSQPFDSVLVGDRSLERRPMERIAKPLRLMGADISLTDGHAPIRIRGRDRLEPADLELEIPSAQVKSAIILAGLTASGASRIREPLSSRDHTERMLGLSVSSEDGVRSIRVEPLGRIDPLDLEIPGDFSSAAFFIAAATMVKGSEVTVLGVGVNPTRTGLLNVLTEAGASISLRRHGTEATVERAADISVRSTDLAALSIQAEVVPLLVDEVPVLAVVASQCVGLSQFRGIAELRAKESDRIESTTELLVRMGAKVSAGADSLLVNGPVQMKGATVESHGDHRIAMAGAVAGLVASGPTTIRGAESAAISYPDFWKDLDALSIR